MTAATPGQAALEPWRASWDAWRAEGGFGPAPDTGDDEVDDRWRKAWTAAAQAGHDAIVAAQEPKPAPGDGIVIDIAPAPGALLNGIPLDEWPDLENPVTGRTPGAAAPELAVSVAALDKLIASRERVMYAALIDIRRGDHGGAKRILGEQLDGWDGPEWDGTETGTQWLDRTREVRQ